jgi:hypothetical protein
MEGDIILLQDIFKFRTLPGSTATKVNGELVATGLRPKFLDKLGEANVEVPASAFKAPAGTTPGQGAASGRGSRKVRVPSQREVADRERLR